ncbi:MAG: zeta toxin family protein [Phycisphaerales bacterium]|nr:zeta toxin family protein [Phycisphaerales bacterium]
MPNETMTDAWRSAWIERCAERLFRGVRAAADPVARILLGQPGAGKSTVAAAMRTLCDPHRGFVHVDADELLYLHPSFVPWAEEDHEAAHQGLSGDAAIAADEITSRAAARSVDLLLEIAPASATVVTDLIAFLADAHYRTELIVVVTEPDVSWAAAITRFEGQDAAFGLGRWVDPDVHDAVCEAMPEVLDAVAEQGLTDRLVLVARGGTTLADSRRGDTSFRALLPASFGGSPTVDASDPTPPAPPSPVDDRSGVRINRLSGRARDVPPREAAPTPRVTLATGVRISRLPRAPTASVPEPSRPSAAPDSQAAPPRPAAPTDHATKDRDRPSADATPRSTGPPTPPPVAPADASRAAPESPGGPSARVQGAPSPEADPRFVRLTPSEQRDVLRRARQQARLRALADES